MNLADLPLSPKASDPGIRSYISLINSWLQARLSYLGSPGVTYSIVLDQELLYAGGVGFADLENKIPARANHIFRIASHSKLFTAIAAMKLRDEGRLTLDDSVKKWLPWFQLKNPRGPEMTLRHLLVHSSGLAREAGSGYWMDFDFPSIGEIRRRLKNQETIFPVEQQWKYSNLGVTLAGEIVAAVSGESFAGYLDTHIFKTLGIQSSSVEFPKNHQKQLAKGYGLRLPGGQRHEIPFIDAKGLAPATGLSSTVQDMAKFLAWQ